MTRLQYTTENGVIDGYDPVAYTLNDEVTKGESPIWRSMPPVEYPPFRLSGDLPSSAFRLTDTAHSENVGSLAGATLP
ncbi:MAG: hypothetical protein GY822_22700 [Deltaproteobacteria bacterium]|nr:hypothetical protein [Deltaproteobacteria bacterium]